MAALILNREPGIAGQLLLNLRDASRHEDRAAFRWNMQRMGRELGSALAQSWPMAKATCTTPLGTAAEDIPAHQPVMACILRAAMPLHQGVLDVWDRADSAFVSAYRKHHNAGFDIEIEYLGAPAMEGRALVLVDPMLATGASLQAAYDARFAKPASPPPSTSLPPSRAKKACPMHRSGCPRARRSFWEGSIPTSTNTATSCLDWGMRATWRLVPRLGTESHHPKLVEVVRRVVAH